MSTNTPGTSGNDSRNQMSPGDDAPPGTPGTGEDICPVCHGSGKRDNRDCPNCGGTGRIVEGIGGG
jgi:DnaJ-class molecular chaperone